MIQVGCPYTTKVSAHLRHGVHAAFIYVICKMQGEAGARLILVLGGIQGRQDEAT
jgi:hypothetical protein